jgi:hypothetical protein
MSNLMCVTLAAAALGVSGCTTLKTGGGSCMFGGATEAEGAVCAQANFGVEGVLHAANQKTAGDCKDHVLAAAQRLAGRYSTEAVLSCPAFIKDCHASALVHTPDGDFVLDNGALRYPGDLMTLAQFRDWIGTERGTEPYQVVSIAHISYLAANPSATLFAGNP